MAHSARNSRIVAPPPTCVSTSPRPNRGPFRSEMAAPDILSDGMSRYPQVQAERHVSLESMYFRDCFSRGYRLLGQQLGRGSYAKVRLAVIERDKYMERTAQHAQRHKLNTFDIEKVRPIIMVQRNLNSHTVHDHVLFLKIFMINMLMLISNSVLLMNNIDFQYESVRISRVAFNGNTFSLTRTL